MRRKDLHEMFQYEPSTGWLINKFMRNTRALKGAIAGSVNGSGAVNLQINGTMYQAHRLVWFMHFGWLPKELDHINRNPADNRLENLRPCTRSQNMANQASRNGSSNYRGVSKHTTGRWQAQTKVNRVQKHLGLFNTEKEAHEAYCRYMQKIHGEYFAT